ncbi:MAG: exodeoxyribonuclease VII large subunit [Bacteroidetes bacterium]|nr:exodeoxyribonuclease VII large subunit [Bacteroidota bacterium]
MSKQIFTLLQVAASIRKTLENRYQNSYWVRAELYKMNEYPSGHAFPELVQRENGKIVANLNGVIWKTHFQRIRQHFEKTVQEPLSEGKELLLEVKIVFNETFGLSLHILDVDASFSLGALHQLRLNTLKKLDQESLLNKNQQLTMQLPKRIALISAKSSKGLSDFYEVIDGAKTRFVISTFLFNCTLQGDPAVDSILTALQKIKGLLHHFDAVAIVRGGGAEVGMSCYDDYRLCKEIAEFPLPVLCGIGHSTNLTVAEMVAFSHAITPSALANNILMEFENAASKIESCVLRLQQKFLDLKRTNQRSIQQMSIKISRITRLNIDTTERELNRLFSSIQAAPKISLAQNVNRLRQIPLALNQWLKETAYQELRKTQKHLHDLQRLSGKISLIQHHQLEGFMKEIALMDPKAVLSRGYAIVRTQNTILASSKMLKSGDLLRIEFNDGQSEAEVK